MGSPVYLHHPSSHEHKTGHHPEQPARLLAVEKELSDRGWLGFERVLSPPVERALLESVHSPEHVAAVEAFAAAGGGWLDVDTIVTPGSWEAALHAAGGAVALVDRLLDGSAPTGISAHRPPGHHATRDTAMGFCLFDNIAVGARHALDAHGLERVLILDWDVHHGNGTNDLFADTDRVLFCSIHQYPFWPGSGAADDTGHGAGEGYTVNLPVPAGSGNELWCSLVEHVVVPVAREYRPQLVLLSAGYDAHADDPMAGCYVTDRGFSTMAGTMARLGAELGAPVGVVLEGGYDLAALARGVADTLAVLSSAEPPAAPELGVHPDALAARERLAARWSL